MKLVTYGAVVLAAALIVAPSSGITVSNRLTPEKDARVVSASVRAKPTWVAPFTWRVTLNDTIRDVFTSRSTYTVADVVDEAYPSCAVYRLTVFPTFPLRDSLTTKLSLCRAESVVERAQADSFPESAMRFVRCTATGYRALSDSSSGLTVAIGDTTTVAQALLARNRYTGVVIQIMGDPVACEPARAAMQAETSG